MRDQIAGFEKRKYEELRRAVCTWLTKDDYRRFKMVAKFNNVTMSMYLQSMIVDVLIEEWPKLPLEESTRLVDTTTNSRQQLLV